jgi:hypothetical protein
VSGLTVAGEPAAGPADPTDLAEVATRSLDAVAGASFLAIGVAAARGSRRHALLAAAAGIAWFLGGLSVPALWLHRPLMLHCALAYPSGRLRGPVPRAAVVAAWVSALVPPLARDAGVSLRMTAAERPGATRAPGRSGRLCDGRAGDLAGEKWLRDAPRRAQPALRAPRESFRTIGVRWLKAC